jgi:hypothetical protein
MFFPDPGSEFFHPGSKRFQIRIKELGMFNINMNIPDPDLDFLRHRIPDPDPQHCRDLFMFLFKCAFKKIFPLKK